MLILFIASILAVISAIFVFVNFIAYVSNGKVKTRYNLWILIQIWTVIILPAIFLLYMDISNKNNCCTDSAVFSPGNRAGIYLLIVFYTAAFVASVAREQIWPPVAELFLNSFLVLGFILNLIFCRHFTTKADGPIMWIFGNVPILLLLVIELAENQKKIRQHIQNNDYSSDTIAGKICISILKLNTVFRYPVLTILLVPLVIFLSLFLMLFGQKPDSLIKAFTDTYKHGFSQLDYLCDNVQCGEHFLCSVGAKGHRKIVKPIRYGERNGVKIICNRQLLISNAFEELIQEKFPGVHKIIRRNYNKVGNLIHKHYHIFNKKIVSDIVYFLMKPLELFFLLTIYSLDKKPENRIAIQYLNKKDRQKIIACQQCL